MRVGFFITCLVDVMRPEIAESAVRLLESAGCSVEVPMAQTCCGQPGYNSGDTPAARALARKFLDEFERFEHVVVPSGSCAGMIRHHYPALFTDDPDLKGRIDALAARTWELTSFLHDVVGLRRLPGRFEGTITYHDSCSGLRELGVQAQPRALLALNPAIELVEMRDARACCGFGGTFSVKYGEISTAIVDEKIDRIRASGASCVVLGDLGCMLNIEGRLRRSGDTATRVLHVAQVLAGDVAPATAGRPDAPTAAQRADAGAAPAPGRGTVSEAMPPAGQGGSGPTTGPAFATASDAGAAAGAPAAAGDAAGTAPAAAGAATPSAATGPSDGPADGAPPRAPSAAQTGPVAARPGETGPAEGTGADGSPDAASGEIVTGGAPAPESAVAANAAKARER